MRTFVKMLLVALIFNFLPFAAFAQQSPPDLILFNGKVFTSNASYPYFEALAIRGERIIAVGTSNEITALAGKETKRIDLGGRVVIPGINDAHQHLTVAPETYDLPIQGNNPKWQQIKGVLSSAITTVSKGTWIDGVFGPSILDDPQATRTALDQLAPDNPVVLWDWTGHASLLNTPALKKLGIRDGRARPACTPCAAGHSKWHEMDSRRHSHRALSRHEEALHGSSRHFRGTELL